MFSETKIAQMKSNHSHKTKIAQYEGFIQPILQVQTLLSVLHGEHRGLHSQGSMCQKHASAVSVQLHGQEDQCRSVSAWIRETDATDSDLDLSG